MPAGSRPPVCPTGCSAHASRKPFDIATGEPQHGRAESHREREEDDGGDRNQRVALTADRHDHHRREQGNDVREVVRGDVDQDRRLHGRWRQPPLLERLCDQHAAADAARRKRLVRKQLGQTELECRPDWQNVATGMPDPTPDPSLREISSRLQQHRGGKPPRLCTLGELKEGLLL